MTTSTRLDGITYCFVSTEAFGGLWRTWKQAQSLRDAGARVVFVGYEHLMPAAFADAGFEVVTATPAPLPDAPAAPAPPDPLPLRDFPACPEAVVWETSEHPNRFVRLLANRTVNWARYRAKSWKNKREHTRTYRDLIRAYSDRSLEYLEAQRAYEQAERAYRKRLVHPILAFDWEANGPLIEAVTATAADVVQAVDLPALDTAWKAAGEMGARLVYAAHELWVGFVRNPDFNPKPSHAAGLLAVERRRIGEADLVTSTSDLMGERLSRMYDIDRPLTLLNSPLTHVTDARPVHDPVRLVFHGGLSRDRNVDGLIRAMASLKGRATLDIHGYDRTARADELQRLVGDLGLEDAVRLHGAYDYRGVVDMLADYDVDVMTGRVMEENFEVTLPNKVFDALCAGLAVATFAAPVMTQLFERVPFGVTLDTDTPETIAAGLGSLLDDPSKVLLMKQAAAARSGEFVWATQGEMLVEAIGGLFSPKATAAFRKKASTRPSQTRGRRRS